jgi:hypothetical protein
MLTDSQTNEIKRRFNDYNQKPEYISDQLNIPHSVVCNVLKVPYLSNEYLVGYFIKHRNHVLRYMEHDSFTREKLDIYILELNKYIDNLQRNL